MIPQEKTEIVRRKHLEPKKKDEVFKKKEVVRVRENRLKKICQNNCRAALQHQPQIQCQTRLQYFKQKKF